MMQLALACSLLGICTALAMVLFLLGLMALVLPHGSFPNDDRETRT